ncbi:restriction endonuclease subunit S [Rhodoferax sp. AJA081-3]|uniref:restriction endonuclease subunit S n=1 Tax=Rhodoferax sp. AJA081-3 TaxID=2752316 RepID=UPI001AE0A172|nr:restriction endonuclease subunit S [Rhodoferax sp. AJA081-3]QTN28084.1 restriction endonuclease subunit S [Rhodoferax sp. AJA081-3]
MNSSARLSDVCRFQNGGTPSKGIERYFTGDIPWITGADLVGQIALQARSFITEEAIASSATNQVPAGTVLLVTRTSVGKVAIAGMSLCFSQDITALTPDAKKLSAEYLVHFLRTKQDHFTKHARGATIQGITREVVADLEIPLPSLEEQRRIADILGQAETLRTQRGQALAHLDTLTQSLFLDMFGDPRSNSKGWREAPVGALTDCIVPGRDKPKSFSGGIPWITTANLVHMGATLPLADALGLSQAEIDEVRAKVIPADSVIISCVGDLGVVSLAGVPMVINQQLHSFQCGAELNNLFLMHSLSFQKAFMLAKASSTTLPYMNKSVCNSIPVLVPPLALQQTFATRIQAIEALKVTHRTALAQLDALFASLQQRAFAGEL